MQLNRPGKEEIKKAAVDGGGSLLTGMAAAVNPGLGVATQICVSLFGSAIERRQDRAIELLQFVQEHISEFSSDVLQDQVFQDGFVLLMEKSIRERNSDKRVILQKVLRGYINAPDLLAFPLEEMADLVSRIRMSDVSILRNALVAEARHEAGIASGEPRSFMLREDPNAVSRLIYFGLLHEDRTTSGPQVREYDEKNFLHVWISPAGRAFAAYINED